MPNSVCEGALLAAVDLASGGRRCPLQIQAVAKSFERATPRSNEVPAVCFRLRIEAVAQLAGKRRASLCRERQYVLENVRGSVLHSRILTATTTGESDPKINMIVPLPEPSIVELLTPRGEPRQKAVVVALGSVRQRR